ncbi:26S proteasome regulatory subunit 6A [Encephalitozoon romaleae SJ-2008]|uniref:26S proteasome regulatory subunit 6A n=1 Tax=Encephalitozoon romaleae (strain SJ-2008) TaxID=1178016 RepID=I6ZW09_ENCRO|nr:26S proteasome regulatory subunit 6A [Encephalitozoon romaleae SJ-2008]AFN83946.1 26S proteasome regulatory subunit 6A [Encephalitozoon romaleae SJ-2008]
MSLEELEMMDQSNPEEFLEKIREKIRMLNSETRILQSRVSTIKHDISTKNASIAENMERIRLNKQLPYLVGNVVEVLDDQSAVVNASTRMSSYLPITGLIPNSELRPGDLVALHKDTNIVFEKLPPDYDMKVGGMVLKSDAKPDETYEDIGGLERQIEELNEAIVLSLTYPERFAKLNIKPPKGVLMYGPPGTGKTLMARACASKTNATFLKLAGPQLVQMYIGDGARLVRDAFALAKEKKPTIIFIDEIDAIGAKRSDSDQTGDREVQRTMLELLNQLDGFSSSEEVKIIAATNRVDILDPALLRSGRLDRKIEFPLPNALGRKRILQIHARKMSVRDDVNFDELARSTEGFNGAQCKAVCVEAGMAALRKEKTEISQNDFMDGIQEVLSRKKSKLLYFT